MNAEQAKRIPLTSILEKINCYPVRYNDKEAWYLLPLRQEKTASFHVTFKTNYWQDFGDGTGGDPIDLLRAYLTLCNINDTVSDALRWISNLIGNMPYIAFIPYDVAGTTDTDRTLVRNSVAPIKHGKTFMRSASKTKKTAMRLEILTSRAV